MSDLSPALNTLRRSNTQLPVSVYFDASLYKEEQERIFQSGPRYLGHALSVPEVGACAEVKGLVEAPLKVCERSTPKSAATIPKTR